MSEVRPMVGDHLLELLRQQASAAPDAEAIVTADDRWTYGQWLEESERVAAALAADGVGIGDTVALLAPSSREWLAVAFGCVALGACLAPFNTWTRGPELDYLLGFSRPTVFLTVGRFARQDFLHDLQAIVPEAWEAGPGTWSSARLPGLRRIVVLDGDGPAGAVRYGDWLSDERYRGPARAAQDDVALVLFTSGSTALPKAVALAHRPLITNGFEIGERQGLGPEDRLLLASPLFWSLGSANALPAALTHRSTLVLQPQFEPAGALALIERERCTALYTLPLMTHALLGDPGFSADRVATLERGLTFGSPHDVRRVVDELGARSICNLYGATEVYGNCVVAPSDAPADRRIAACGPPLPGVELRIVDPETRAERPTGEVGEIFVRGRVCAGYLDAEGGLSSATDPDGWFVTGDLGALDADGWLTFAGRSSEMIKSAGINVSPAEVEAVLLGHEDVAEAAVTGAPHQVRGEQVVAFVRLRPGATVDPEALRAWARDRAASYKVPSAIVVVEQLPTTPTGKLARRELRSLAGGYVDAR